MENIGARRLNTVIERVFEELSFTARTAAAKSVSVDADSWNAIWAIVAVDRPVALRAVNGGKCGQPGCWLAEHKQGKDHMGWLFSVIIFAWMSGAIAQSSTTNASNKSKILWILLIVILPVVGLIIWYFADPSPTSGFDATHQ